MADVPARGQRFAWILLVCGLVSFAASVTFLLVLILEDWSLTGFLNVIWTSSLGLMWVLLYRRSVKQESVSGQSPPGPN